MEAEFNDLLERATEMRKRRDPIPTPEVNYAYPLLGSPLKVAGATSTAPYVVPALPVTLPPGFAVAGNEAVSCRALIHMGLLPAGGGGASDGAEATLTASTLTRGLPIVDPFHYTFTPGQDAGLVGEGIDGWSHDVWPRLRPAKYLDPRRSDDEVDGAYLESAPLPLSASVTAIYGYIKTYNLHEVAAIAEGRQPPGALARAPSVPGAVAPSAPVAAAVAAASAAAAAAASRGGFGALLTNAATVSGGSGGARGPRGGGGAAAAASLAPPQLQAVATAAAAAAVSSISHKKKQPGDQPSNRKVQQFASLRPPRVVQLGYRLNWDVSLARALEACASMADAHTFTLLRQGAAGALAGVDAPLTVALATIIHNAAGKSKSSAGGGGAGEEGGAAPAAGVAAGVAAEAVAVAAAGAVAGAVAGSTAPAAAAAGGDEEREESSPGSFIGMQFIMPPGPLPGQSTPILVPFPRLLDASSDSLMARGLEAGSKLLSNPASLPEACLLPSGMSRSEAEASLESTLTYPQLKRALLRWHAANLEYGCAAPLGSVSLASWDQDDSFAQHDAGRHFFLRDGYDTHVRGMLADVPVHYGVEAARVEWQGGAADGNGVRVHLRSSSSGGDEEAAADATAQLDVDAVLVTVPLGVLQEDRPSFSPPLPAWKTDAIRALGRGLLNKVCIRFPTAFWRDGGAVAPSAGLGEEQGGGTVDEGGAGAAGSAAFRVAFLSALGITPSATAAAAAAATSTLPATSAATSSSSSSAIATPRDGGSSTLSRSRALQLSQHRLPLRKPMRVVSAVPFLPNHLHLNPYWMDDAQLLTASALALQAQPEAQGGAWAAEGAPPDLWDALAASGEARGCMRRSGVLLRRWCAQGEEEAAAVDAEEAELDAEEAEAEAAAGGGGGGCGGSGSMAGELEGGGAVASLPRRRRAALEAAAAGLEGAAAFVDAEARATAAEEAALLLQTAAVDEEWASRTASAREGASRLFTMPPIPPPGTMLLPEGAALLQLQLQQGPSLPPPPPQAPPPTHMKPHDDAFCRVVLGDTPEDVKRRGESYMFWCMDRPSQGAGLRPVPSAADGSPPPAFLAAAGASGGLLPPVSAQDGEPVLIAMMAGDAAEWVEGASDAEVMEAVMEALRSLFGAATVPAPVGHIITRWRSDPWARGSYSHLPPGAHGMHYDAMAAPVGEALFFAGEATNRHHPTTAAGAFDSGLREAVRIGRLHGRTRDPAVVALLAAREARLAACAGASSGGH